MKKLEIKKGKIYRIIGEVATEHGDCQGRIITAVDFGHSSVWFHGLSWVDGDIGEYILCYPDAAGTLDGEKYFEWLYTVLEEVE